MIECKKCGKASLNFVSLMCIADPQDFVLVQCPNCKTIDTIPKMIWYRDLPNKSVKTSE